MIDIGDLVAFARRRSGLAAFTEVAGAVDTAGASEVAEMLASVHPPGDLGPVFAAAGEELRACLVQELVLRRAELPADPGATIPRDHPLAALPLELGPEEQPDLPSFTATGGSWGLPSGPWRLTVPDPRPWTSSWTPADPPDAAAIERWCTDSNGRFETRAVHGPSVPSTPCEVAGALAGLGLDCLAGADTPIAVAACPPEQAWRVLFGAAAHGGAYSSGWHGAYGRVHAWRTAASLAGAPAEAPHEVARRHVLGCTWYRFEAESRWFHKVAWDIGIVAVRPAAPSRFAVLAATDTD